MNGHRNLVEAFSLSGGAAGEFSPIGDKPPNHTTGTFSEL
jgi:hypothetical protein